MSIIETAPAYYEYGNALLRWAIRQRDDAEGHEVRGEAANDITAVASTTTISSAEANKRSLRESIAAAAERRRQSKIEETISTTTNDVDGKVKSEQNAEDADDDENNDDTTTNHDGDSDAVSGDEDDDDDDENGSLDDIQLALEMMETSWSILDAYQQQDRSEHHPNNNNNNRKNYDAWVMEQIPRVLTGIGDALSVLDRHADAADAYLRALDHRQTVLNQYLSDHKRSH